MRSVAAITLFAGAALAEYTATAYSTQEVTITSCGPEVTNCPASSTKTPHHSTPAAYTPPAYSTPETTPVYTAPASSPTAPSVYTPTTPPGYSSPPVYTSIPVNSSPVYSSPVPVYSSPVSPVYSSQVSPVSSPAPYSSPVGGSCPPAVTSTYTVTVTAPGGGSGYPSPVYSSSVSPVSSPAPYPTVSASGYTSGVPTSTGGYPTYPTPSSPPINAGGKVQAGVFAAAVGAVAAFFL